MGTLIGHVGPGLGFFLIGSWHLYNHLKILAQKGPTRYKNRPWFHHLELYLIILATATSLAMELFIGPRNHQPLDPSDLTIPTNHLHNFEHSSISLTFLVYAASALVLDRHLTPARHDVVQAVGAVAFGQQLVMFHMHSSDHVGVEGQYHRLLELVIFVSLATTVVGIAGPRSFVVGFTRSLSVAFQGVWLVVMGFALWTPGLVAKGCVIKEEEGHKVVRCEGEDSLHRAKALVNIQFSWLLILLVIFGVTFYVIMMRRTVYEYCPMDEQVRGLEPLTLDEKDIEVQKIVN